MTNPCPHESDLLDALQAGFVNAELESHIDGCSGCHELRTVAGALLDDRAIALSEAQVPASGTMWWRMKIRSRQDAETKTRRALVVGQAATILIALALIVALLGNRIVPELNAALHSATLSPALIILIGCSAFAAVALPIAGIIVGKRD